MEDIDYCKEHLSEIRVSDDVKEYLMAIVEATRKSSQFALGASTRGALALYHAAQVEAAIAGRDYVIPEDIKYLAPFVLNHRVSLKGITRREDCFKAVEALVDTIPVPTEG
jgi:MoxR-like ATPase